LTGAVTPEAEIVLVEPHDWDDPLLRGWRGRVYFTGALAVTRSMMTATGRRIEAQR
jgi:hypothetical protein